MPVMRLVVYHLSHRFGVISGMILLRPENGHPSFSRLQVGYKPPYSLSRTFFGYYYEESKVHGAL